MMATQCPVCGGFRDGAIWMVDPPVCTCPRWTEPFVAPTVVPLPAVPIPVVVAPRQGWICPRCNRGCAPHLDYCDCAGAYRVESTAITVTSS